MPAWIATLALFAAAPDAPLQPLPDHGAVPKIVELQPRDAGAERRFRAARRRFRQTIRRIRHEHFGGMRVEAIRAEGVAQLRELTDPAAFGPLVEELAGERDDVRLAVLEHLAGHGDAGQAALARAAIHDADPAFRAEAARRLVAPAPPQVLAVVEQGLRSNEHAVANAAGVLAGTLRAVELIPLLIFAQATADPVQSSGDLAWIAVATQRAFVAGVQPVVGDGAGAFQPIPGIVTEGTILRVVDAVAIFYRTEVHRSLVALSTEETGESTARLGYDMRAWWHWYNQQYVPLKNAQVAESAS